jgi:hypothetical protein
MMGVAVILSKDAEAAGMQANNACEYIHWCKHEHYAFNVPHCAFCSAGNAAWFTSGSYSDGYMASAPCWTMNNRSGLVSLSRGSATS